MKVTIEADIAETGNPQRGYHNYDAAIEFKYADDSTLTAEREKGIVEAIVGARPSWMWHTITSRGPRKWSANYGYDSGD